MVSKIPDQRKEPGLDEGSGEGLEMDIRGATQLVHRKGIHSDTGGCLTGCIAGPDGPGSGFDALSPAGAGSVSRLDALSPEGVGQVSSFGALSPAGLGPVSCSGALSPAGVGPALFPPVVQSLPGTSPSSHALLPSGEERFQGGGQVGVGQERPVQGERFRA
jgi:hypothetical protein